MSGYGAATFWDPTLTTSTANPVTVASGQTTTVGIALVATDITVSGQVTDQAGGNAIPGASVFFQGALPTPPAVPGACNSNGTPPAPALQGGAPDDRRRREFHCVPAPLDLGRHL